MSLRQSLRPHAVKPAQPVAGTGPGSEELPTTEEFFLPGSGASRGLTSADLEASRTATWDDNMATLNSLDADAEDEGALRYFIGAQLRVRL